MANGKNSNVQEIERTLSMVDDLSREQPFPTAADFENGRLCPTQHLPRAARTNSCWQHKPCIDWQTKGNSTICVSSTCASCAALNRWSYRRLQ
jgi:hypothetical protein